jgi:quercetin dioxygenase-like cupin family protein
MGYSKMNWFHLPPNADGVHHYERESGQEEVNMIIRESGTYVIDGEEISIREGDVFRFDPDTERGPKAGPDGLVMVAVAARRGSYEPRGPY